MRCSEIRMVIPSDLFKRVKAVYEKRQELELTPAQARLLVVTYKGFERGGANLDPEKQAKPREINSELSLLELQFADNVLAETNNIKLVIENSGGQLNVFGTENEKGFFPLGQG